MTFISILIFNNYSENLTSELKAKEQSMSKKSNLNFLVLNMRDRPRYIIIVDSMDYCLEHTINKSKNIVTKEIKNLLLVT